jgi:hypothetical protein
MRSREDADSGFSAASDTRSSSDEPSVPPKGGYLGQDLLIGGDKTGEKRFYEGMIRMSERIWTEYLNETAQVE